MACTPFIADPLAFPQRPHNRPGLPRIAYRIGRYADFLEAMTRAIDTAPQLAGWTHRETDDPAIALLHGAAILGDILTFYQEHYANEAYLRTAAWRDSVAELVRLTGYRLAPAIGGRATLAFEARGTAPVQIGPGFAVKIPLADAPQSADFQTDAPLDVWPPLSRFHLYRPRIVPPRLAAGAMAFDLAGVDGAGDIKAGDRLLLLPDEPAWTTNGGATTAQQPPQVVKLKAVTRLLGRLQVTLETPVLQDWSGPVQACRIGRTFRHLGHNAPARTVNNTLSGNTITGASERATNFVRHVSWLCEHTDASIGLEPDALPLDAEVADLQAGAHVVLQTTVSRAGAAAVPLCVLRRITALAARTLGFGNLNGPATVLTLHRPLIGPAGGAAWTSDVRHYRLHEVTGPRLTVQPLSTPSSAPFTAAADTLCFYGSAAEARLLAGRRLYLAHADGRHVELVCTSRATDFPVLATDAPAMRRLHFDRLPAPFRHADFDEAAPTVTVFGNLVDASQGKAEHEVVLGNGDNRQSWQTFPLKKTPLTHFLAADGVPPYRPALSVWVGGRQWRQVDAFFGHGAQEPVFIVREDGEGRSFVQFGDGATGARLPSGLNNVVARYRSGAGARGAGKDGAPPTVAERPPGFDKVSLAGIVSGGAAAEDGARARVAAPGKVQGLGRLVSIQDYETETLTVPGVVTAAAAWDLHAGVPAVVLRILLEAGRAAELSTVRATLAHAQRCRGPDRFPLVVQQALLRYVYASISYARDPAWPQQEVDTALRAALGLAGDEAHEGAGLFGLRARRLGEREYASRIEGRLQNVPGVLWCKVTALGRLGVDPAAPLPPAPRLLLPVLPCSAHELLQLAPAHLVLAAVAEPAAGACA